MKYTLEFEINDLPETTNSIGRKHWAIKAKEARKWRNLVCAEVFGKRPRTSLRSARLSLTRFSSRCPDSDGLVSSFKHVIDGLIQAKVLVGDSYQEIGMPEYKWEKAKQKEGKIKVRVEEIIE